MISSDRSIKMMYRGLAILLSVAVFQSVDPTAAQAEADFDRQRQEMVTRQLRARDITDARVLSAMHTVPRHRFVPKALQLLAYRDTPLPIGHGQTISQPYMVALMSQVLSVRPGQRILEIGTGSGDGYQGWPDHSPFDAIIVTCAPTRIPEPLKAQLAEGGRMVIPTGEEGEQQLLLLVKQNDEIKQEKIVDVRFVPMVNRQGKRY
jgi:protein-L-isoaspartate(D-aspartate) O-methyltransferase